MYLHYVSRNSGRKRSNLCCYFRGYTSSFWSFLQWTGEKIPSQQLIELSDNQLKTRKHFFCRCFNQRDKKRHVCVILESVHWFYEDPKMSAGTLDVQTSWALAAYSKNRSVWPICGRKGASKQHRTWGINSIYFDHVSNCCFNFWFITAVT